MIPPKPDTILCAGDHLFVTLKPHLRTYLDSLFSTAEEPLIAHLSVQPASIKANTTVGMLAHFYGLPFKESDTTSLAQFMQDQLEDIRPQAQLSFKGVVFTVEKAHNQHIDVVSFLTNEDS